MSPLRRLWNTIRRNRMDDELRQELETHLALIEEEEQRQGVPVEQARQKERERLGSPLVYRERTTDAVGLSWLADFGKDIRFALRSLARTPGFFAAALLTLALGIGANAAIFSLIRSTLLAALPFTDSRQLAIVWTV